MHAQVKATPIPEPTKDPFDPKRIYEENDVDIKPKRISGPSTPNYPGSLKAGEKVSVSVSWVIDENGEILEPKILESGGKKVDEATLQMLAKQKYEPGSKKGTKVKVRMNRIYSFRSG
jgi:periplasmic protein TonB